MEKSIGIIGQGFVGSAIREGLKDFYKINTFDIDKSKSKYFKNTFQKYQINESEVDYYFINQNNSDGFNYTKICRIRCY